MATQAQIKKTILQIAGNPETGSIKELADEMARAIAELDKEPAKESRVIEAAETR